MQKAAVCPECDSEVCFPTNPALDQRTICPRCGSELVVIRINPTVLDWAFVEPLSRPDRNEYLDVRSFQAWDDN